MRLIDAEPIEKYIENGLNEKDPAKRFGHDAIEIMTEIHYAPTIAPPPNDPLTLEELREMDGEPVWISSKGINRYDICCKVTTDNMVQFYTVALPGLGYGKTWLAYRRKPEEEYL